MILADTSIWIAHLRQPDALLARALRRARVVIHPFVIGEVALGSLRDRATIIAHLSALPPAKTAASSEVLAMIENLRLFGSGIGYVDAHLLASALLTPGTTLWTHDRRLHEVAVALAVTAAR